MNTVLLIMALILTMATAAPADSLLIVQSSRSTVADAAVAGFRSACNLESRTLILSDYAEVDLPRIVRNFALLKNDNVLKVLGLSSPALERLFP